MVKCLIVNKGFRTKKLKSKHMPKGRGSFLYLINTKQFRELSTNEAFIYTRSLIGFDLPTYYYSNLVNTEPTISYLIKT